MEQKIYIEGMSCDHCVKRVQKALEGLEGVKKANVSLKQKMATISADQPVSKEDIVSVIDDAGYIVNRVE